MTVAELIQRLSAFPPDMPILFTADMGFIAGNEPTFEVDARDGDDGDDDTPTLFIAID